MKITRRQLKQLIAEELNVGVPMASMEENAGAGPSTTEWVIVFSKHGAYNQVIKLVPAYRAPGSQHRFNNISELVAHMKQADSVHSAAGTPGFLTYTLSELDMDPKATELMLDTLESYRQSLISLTA